MGRAFLQFTLMISFWYRVRRVGHVPIRVGAVGRPTPSGGACPRRVASVGGHAMPFRGGDAHPYGVEPAVGPHTIRNLNVNTNARLVARGYIAGLCVCV